MLSIAQLEADIEQKHTPASSRGYLMALRRLARYNGSDTIAPDDLRPEYITDFAHWLAENDTTPATTRQILKMVRSSLKPHLSLTQRRQLFAGVDTATAAPTRLLDADDMRRIANASPGNLPPLLEKARRQVLHAFYAFDGTETPSTHQLPQQLDLGPNTAGRPDPALLQCLGRMLGLRHQLTPDSYRHAWLDASRRLKTSNRAAIANYVHDLSPRWYVMRCFADSPAELATRLQNHPGVTAATPLETFVPPTGHTPEHCNDPGAIINRMLFVRCAHRLAAELRTDLRATAHLYTTPGSTRPAPIADSDMLAFMLVCDIADSQIAYHFPDQPTVTHSNITPGTPAIITDGTLSGHVGIIRRPSRTNRYKVIISLHTIGTITAEVPISFLRPITPTTDQS